MKTNNVEDNVSKTIITKYVPKVNEVAEIREIAEDFTNPMELFREGISNAYDAKASHIKIEIFKAREGEYKINPLTIRITDNGLGMDRKQLENFWDLGWTKKRNSKEEYIGCKGHGTAIFLKSQYIEVRTVNEKNAYRSYCAEPMRRLLEGILYEPVIEELPKDGQDCMTEITIEGYIEDETAFSNNFSKLERIKDYILWFTKHGSVEKEFNINQRENTIVELRVFDKVEELKFGHRFAPISNNMAELNAKYNERAAKYYVDKYQKSICLEKFPNYKVDMVIYFEGEDARRKENAWLEDQYKESSKYGIYLCKDYIPIERKNEWIKTTFYGGSNGYVRLHGFINCQDFKLTANRGSVSIKNQDVLEEIRKEVSSFIDYIETEIEIAGVKKAETNMKAVKCLEDENIAYIQRRKNAENKEYYQIGKDDIVKEVFVPENETELLLVYSQVDTLFEDEFPFKPVDYNSTKGIDMLVKTEQEKQGKKYAYVELKKVLDNKKGFNHSFSNLLYILCWEVSPKIKDDDEFWSSIDGRDIKWKIKQIKGKKYLYNTEGSLTNIQIIELKNIFEKYLIKKVI